MLKNNFKDIISNIKEEEINLYLNVEEGENNE